ncbi:MAG TPA: hypothetical protein VFI47_11080 [Acidimicrobiales bacterium]|nr:hypothetical protein [Acidimicrobiales bacterium]
MRLRDLCPHGVAVALVATLVVGCADATDRAPICDRRQLATGEAYQDSPGLAVAVSRGVEPGHPGLSPLIDAVAEFQVEHPTMARSQPEPGRPPRWGLSYVIVLVALAEHPEAATPAMIGHLVDSAEYEGMRGVVRLVEDDREHPADAFGGRALETLRSEYAAANRAILASGVETWMCADGRW